MMHQGRLRRKSANNFDTISSEVPASDTTPITNSRSFDSLSSNSKSTLGIPVVKGCFSRERIHVATTSSTRLAYSTDDNVSLVRTPPVHPSCLTMRRLTITCGNIKRMGSYNSVAVRFLGQIKEKLASALAYSYC